MPFGDHKVFLELLVPPKLRLFSGQFVNKDLQVLIVSDLGPSCKNTGKKRDHSVRVATCQRQTHVGVKYDETSAHAAAQENPLMFPVMFVLQVSCQDVTLASGLVSFSLYLSVEHFYMISFGIPLTDIVEQSITTGAKA